ncbi:alpha/beta fold hydrolase [Niveispirillum sp. KHB5.9]|uniref:alpha/beta fold hydrolase n=1 Tax=Niveispirillum sp. KHB5.9 TaxID=3400269 RepID=UPI003A8BD08D
MSVFLSEKSTIVRNNRGAGGWLDGLSGLFHPWSHQRHQLAEGRRMYLAPERAVSPPALPEPAGGVVLAVPGFNPHLAARIWGAERGEAAPLVLLVHDWEGQIHDMLGFVQPLLDQGARVVAFDAPAHGRSSGDETNLLEMARAIRAVAVAAGGKLAGVIAHGVGAAALTLAIQDGLQAGRAVLLAPLVDLTLPLRQIAHVLRLDMEAEHALTRSVDKALGQPLAALHLHGDVYTPSLLIHSADDRIMPVSDALLLAATWPGMATHLVQGLGHRRLLSDADVVEHSVGFALRGR